MGRREADRRGAMNSSERSELGCLQDSASSSSSSSQHGAERLRRTAGRDPCSLERAATAAPAEVKKHLHKHNLKHRYEVMETLGKGTYGKVKKAVEKASLRTVAIKSIRKDRITEDLERIHIQREIEITSSLCHPNIIRFHEVFESRDKIVIVMEFASRGELYDYIKERRRLPETEARSIFRQITSAVHYCHKNGVVHRDLKLENILLDQDLNVKLADFGLSNNFHRDSLLQTYCGSPLYASPEIVKGLPYVGPEVDCWALGVLLYALVYSSMPFDGTSHAKLTEQISHGRYHRPNPPSDACPLIDWLLTVRVQERATIEDVANHWWVNWGYEQSVCDCPSSPYQECPSPLLARYIDWQNQAAPNMSNDPGCLSSHFSYPPHVGADPFFFSSSLKPNCGAAGGKVCGGILSLRKSRKENAIPQTVQGSCGDASTTPPSSTNEKRKPKGILKHQRSLDSVFHSSPKEDPSSGVCNTHSQPYRTQILGHTPSSILSTNLKPSSAFKQPSSKMPKKGILKNLYVRESSFDSFSEKEGCGKITKEGAAGHSHYCQQHTSLTSAENSPNMHTEAVRRRKGILKRNGKFSQSLDLPDDSCSSSSSTTAVLPEALQQLLQAAAEPESHHSRPSSVVSEDSLFSSDSYDLLDLSTQAHRKIFSHEMHHHACSSEENLEQLRTDDYEVVEDA